MRGLCAAKGYKLPELVTPFELINNWNNWGQSKLKFSLFISFACQEAGYFVTLK